MKKLFLLLFALPMMATAQDTIVTKQGTIIPCEIQYIYPNYMVYKTSTGTLINISNNDVLEKVVNTKPHIITPEVEFVQDNFNRQLRDAGKELRGAARTWFAGFSITLIGAALTGGGAALLNKSPDAAAGMMVGGGVLTAVGGVTMVISFSNIGKAGEYLESLPNNK